MHINCSLIWGWILAIPLVLHAATAAAPPIDAISGGWMSYMAAFSHGVGTTKIESELTSTANGKSSKSIQRYESKIKFAAGSGLVEMNRDIDGEKRRLVYGLNPRYAFQLEHRKGGWMLSEITQAKDPERLPIGRNVRWMVGNEMSPLVAIGDESVADYVRHLSVRPTPDGVVVLGSTSGFAAVGSKFKKTYQQITLTLGQAPFYPVTRSEAETTINNVPCKESRIFVTKMVGRLPLPVTSTFVESYSGKGASGETTTRTEYDIDPTANPPESDFTLTAYGLPEPQGVTLQRPTPRYLYLLAAALGLAVLAVVFRWLARLNARGSGVLRTA